MGEPPREVAELCEVLALLPDLALAFQFLEPLRHPVEGALEITDLSRCGLWDLDAEVSPSQQIGALGQRPERPGHPAR